MIIPPTNGGGKTLRLSSSGETVRIQIDSIIECHDGNVKDVKPIHLGFEVDGL